VCRLLTTIYFLSCTSLSDMDIAQQVPQHPRVRDVLADQCQRLFFEYLERYPIV